MQARRPISRKHPLAESPVVSSAGQRLRVEYWPVAKLKPYERNPRKNDKAVDRIRASIREFGFAVSRMLPRRSTSHRVRSCAG